MSFGPLYVLNSLIVVLRNAFGLWSCCLVAKAWTTARSASFLVMSRCVISIPRCWLNGSIRPVLKHGPRSLTYAQVCGRQTRMRNESDSWYICANDRPRSSERGLSKSVEVRTRKMVNYAWVERSLGKLRWRLVAILTCKSFVIHWYRGERLIEPSSSWFPPKFPSG